MNVPAFIHAGDTVAWIESLPEFKPSEGWSLEYKLVNTATSISIGTSIDGENYSVSIPATVSSTWAPGRYTWVAFVTRGSERYTVGSGEITVKPNLAGVTSGYDPRTPAQKALDDLRAALLAWLASGGTVQSYTIAGRTMTYRSIAEIRRAISLAEREVAREKAAEKLASGIDPGRRVLVRF